MSISALKDRIEKYRADGKNLFSTSEAIMIALCYPDLFDKLMPEVFKNDPKAGYYELDQEQRTSVDDASLTCQISGKTLMMIQELRAKSEKDRTISEAMHDCVYICHEFFDEIKSGVLIDAKYPETE